MKSTGIGGSASVCGAQASVGGGALGRVWGSQPHPVIAKLGPQQIFTEYVLCARHGDTVVNFRDKNSYLGQG